MDSGVVLVSPSSPDSDSISYGLGFDSVSAKVVLNTTTEQKCNTEWRINSTLHTWTSNSALGSEVSSCVMIVFTE